MNADPLPHEVTHAIDAHLGTPRWQWENRAAFVEARARRYCSKAFAEIER